MIEFIKKQRLNYPKICEVFRFLLIGGLATIIDMLFMALIIYLPNKEIFANNFINVFFNNYQLNDALVVGATTIGFIVGLIFNYFFSIIYVYDGDNNYAKTKKGFIMFSILSTIGLLIQSLGMFVGYSLLGLNEWLIKIILVFVVLVFNYITRKIFIFNKKDKTKTEEFYLAKNSFVVQHEDKLTKKSLFLNILFILSSIGLCLIMYNPAVFIVNYSWTIYLKYAYTGLTVIILTIYLFFINKNILSKITLKQNNFRILFSFIYSLGILLILFQNANIGIVAKIIFTILSAFAIFCYSYLLVGCLGKFIKRFWNSLTRFHKKLFISLLIFGILFCSITICFTSIFTYPGWYYDRFFSFDTGALIQFKYHAYQIGPETDIRHMLMAICAMPFTIIPSMIASIFSNLLFEGFLISLVQVVLMDYCIIKIIQMLKIENKGLILTLALLQSVCAGTFYNVLTTEKFVFALFYIISTIDFSIKKSPLKWVFFIGAIGSLSTNIFLLPIVIFTDKKPIKDWFAEVIFCGIIILCVLIITGQANLLLFGMNSWNNLKYFSSVHTPLPFYNKILQMLTFISTIFITPNVTINDRISQALPAFNFLAILGIVILLINLASFIINRKNKYAQICFYWQFFMIFLLVIVGWGATLNEMFIYSALFTWSTVSLVFLLFDKLFRSNNWKITIFSIITAIVITYNIITFTNIMIFATNNFPGVVSLFLKI